MVGEGLRTFMAATDPMANSDMRDPMSSAVRCCVSQYELGHASALHDLTDELRVSRREGYS